MKLHFVTEGLVESIGLALHGSFIWVSLTIYPYRYGPFLNTLTVSETKLPDRRTQNSIERTRQSNSTESQIPALPLQKLQGSQRKSLCAEHILLIIQSSSIDWSLSSAIQLPEVAIFAFDEAYVV